MCNPKIGLYCAAPAAFITTLHQFLLDMPMLEPTDLSKSWMFEVFAFFFIAIVAGAQGYIIDASTTSLLGRAILAVISVVVTFALGVAIVYYHYKPLKASGEIARRRRGRGVDEEQPRTEGPIAAPVALAPAKPDLRSRTLVVNL